MSRSVLETTILEGTSAAVTATVENEDGDALGSGDLSTLTLTLYDAKTGNVINSREGQNVLNQNQVTLSAGGKLEWSMLPADNDIIGTTPVGTVEIHVALFRWTWADGAKAGAHEVVIPVKNLSKVS